MKRHQNLGLVVALVIAFSINCWAQADHSTERVLYNAKVFTAEPASPYAQAVAIHGDKIVAVGSREEVSQAVSKSAEAVDMQGKMVLPGFIDSHEHTIDSGSSLITAQVDESIETVDALMNFAVNAKNSGKGMRGEVLFLPGLGLSFWSQTDKLNSRFNSGKWAGQPVILEGSDGHSGWANRAARERAGVTRDFLSHLAPRALSYYGHAADFSPNGFAVDAGLDKIEAQLPPRSEQQMLEGGRAALRYNSSLGITAWIEPSGGSTSVDDFRKNILGTYRKLAQRGELHAHVAVFPLIDSKIQSDQFGTIQALQQEFKDVPNLAITGVKFFEDGVVEYPSHTAALSKPYSDGGNGELLFDPARFASLATEADKRGLIVHVHAIGDQAVKVALDAIAAARKANGDSGLPHTITHLQFVSPADVLRFRQLGVIASMQLLWAQGEPDTIEMIKPYIDPEVYKWQYPARSLLQAGAIVAGASDWNVSSANVFDAMYYAETRKGSEGVLLPDERMPREAMLYAYTRNAARAMNQQDKIGSIAPGKQADLVLVDRDVLTVSPEEVKDTKVLWTMFGGEIIYRAKP